MFVITKNFVYINSPVLLNSLVCQLIKFYYLTIDRKIWIYTF